jgi:hypothetical protein
MEVKAYRGGVRRIGSATTRFRGEHAWSMLSFVYGKKDTGGLA